MRKTKYVETIEDYTKYYTNSLFLSSSDPLIYYKTTNNLLVELKDEEDINYKGLINLNDHEYNGSDKCFGIEATICYRGPFPTKGKTKALLVPNYSSSLEWVHDSGSIRGVSFEKILFNYYLDNGTLFSIKFMGAGSYHKGMHRDDYTFYNVSAAYTGEGWVAADYLISIWDEILLRQYPLEPSLIRRKYKLFKEGAIDCIIITNNYAILRDSRKIPIILYRGLKVGEIKNKVEITLKGKISSWLEKNLV